MKGRRTSISSMKRHQLNKQGKYYREHGKVIKEFGCEYDVVLDRKLGNECEGKVTKD